jgi:hypothetical protein
MMLPVGRLWNVAGIDPNRRHGTPPWMNGDPLKKTVAPAESGRLQRMFPQGFLYCYFDEKALSRTELNPEGFWNCGSRCRLCRQFEPCRVHSAINL